MEANEVRQTPARSSYAGAVAIGVTYFLLFGGWGTAWANEPPAATTPAAPGGSMLGAALPSFQPGLWQYQRTFMHPGLRKPQVTTIKKCTNPTADIEQKMAELQKKCQFAPVRHEHDHYASSWVCPTVSGPVRFRDVLTAKGASAYQDVSEARGGERVTAQKIEAVRLGDCPLPLTSVPNASGVNATPRSQH